MPELNKSDEPETSRQADIVNDAIGEINVALIGAGTAGSWAAPLLIKLGVRSLDIWDHDIVDTPNVSSQMYGLSHLGEQKVHALHMLLASMGDNMLANQLNVYPDTFSLKKAGKSVPNVVISAVDNWAGRKEALAWAQKGAQMFIECRMMGRLGIVHAIDPSKKEDVTWLLNTFGENDNGPATPCGMRGTAFLGAFIGAQVAAYVTNLANGEPFPRETAYNLGAHVSDSLPDDD